jgi:hypothetical protein
LPIDPFGICRKAYPYEVASVLFTVSFPLSFIANLLVAVFWHRAVAKGKLRENRPLLAFFSFIALFAVGLIAAEIGADGKICIEYFSYCVVERATRAEGALSIVFVAVILYFVSLVCIALYCMYSGYKMLKMLEGLTDYSQRKKQVRVLETLQLKP